MPCTGPAGGVLTGTYPNPGLADDVVDLNNLTDDAKPALNLLSNPGFNYAQLYDPTVYTTLVDNAVAADCWRCTFDTSGGSAVQYKRIANNASYQSIYRGSFKKTVANGKMMIYQPLENLISLGIMNHSITFNLALNMSTQYNLHFAMLRYNGATADVLTSPVSAWNGAGVAPTLAANWAYEFDYPSVITAGLHYWFVDYGSLSTSGFTNFAIALFSDDVITSGDLIEMAETGLYNGFGGRFVWNPLPQSDDIARVERFIEKTYDPDVKPGTITNVSRINCTQASGAHVEPIVYKQRKVKAPAVTFYNPSSGAAGSWRDIDLSADVTMTADDIGTHGFGARASAGGTNTSRLAGHVLLDSSL